MTTYTPEEAFRKLVLIAGASKGIGKAFYDRFRSESNTRVIGIGRSRKCDVNLDLMDSNACYSFVRDSKLYGDTPATHTHQIIYIHSVGIDKFEPEGIPEKDNDGDGIDDDIFASNYRTFRNIVDPLVSRSRDLQKPLTLVAIGSISDVYNVPYWQSFTRSKNRIRQYLKSVGRFKVSSLVLNVSSVLDEKRRTHGRKNANITYWLHADELVKLAFGIINNPQSNYSEHDFFEMNPMFSSDYFTNLPELYAKWQRELGYEGKPIPRGIRI